MITKPVSGDFSAAVFSVNNVQLQKDVVNIVSVEPTTQILGGGDGRVRSNPFLILFVLPGDCPPLEVPSQTKSWMMWLYLHSNRAGRLRKRLTSPLSPVDPGSGKSAFSQLFSKWSDELHWGLCGGGCLRVFTSEQLTEGEFRNFHQGPLSLWWSRLRNKGRSEVVRKVWTVSYQWTQAWSVLAGWCSTDLQFTAFRFFLLPVIQNSNPPIRKPYTDGFDESVVQLCRNRTSRVNSVH